MSENEAQIALDGKRLDWLEEMHTLHKAVEFLYVVDGYNVTLTYDGNALAQYHGATLRDAIDAAMLEHSPGQP